MTTTPDQTSPIEELLSAALAARADLVRPEDLAPLAPVVQLRPRWQSPWVLLATAAVVLLILGAVFQGIGRDPRSDDVAPKPDAPKPDDPSVTLPVDVGRDWGVSPESTPAKADLDGDGTKEKVEFLAEQTKNLVGRIRLQTTLSSTGEEAYGIADVQSTIGLTAEGVIDADGDGDQELVVFDPDPESGPNSGGAPLVFDLRDGLLVQAVAADPDLLRRGDVAVPGSQTEFYDEARVTEYWITDGNLSSGRSVDSFARAGMNQARPLVVELETWKWQLDDDGVLRPEAAGCKELRFEVGDCTGDASSQVPDLGAPVESYVGVGESADYTRSYPFSVRVDAGDPPLLFVQGYDSGTLQHQLDVPDPRVSAVQPDSTFYQGGVSLVVTSASDPTVVQLLVQRGERIVVLEPAGEVALANTDDTRTWHTENGSVVSAVAGEDDTWQLWLWQVSSRNQAFAIPSGTVCFDDVGDPSTMRAC